MQWLFSLVANALHKIAFRTGVTYEEINVLVYFILVPLPYLYLLDSRIGGHYLILGFLVLVLAVCISVRPFSRLSSILFDRSVRFLESFHAVGLNYVQASVVVCVIIPLLALVVLILII